MNDQESEKKPQEVVKKSKNYIHQQLDNARGHGPVRIKTKAELRLEKQKEKYPDRYG